MKIVFITQYYLPQNNGGTELYIYNLCRHLSELKVETAVCCSAPGLETEANYVHDGIDVYTSTSTDKLVHDIYQLTKSQGFDVVHIHTMGGNLSNLLLQSLVAIRVPVFFTPHLVDNFCLNNGKLLYKNSSACTGYVSKIKCQSCISSVYPAIPSFYRNRVFQFALQYMLPKKIAAKLFTSFHFLASEMTGRIRLLKTNKIKIIPVAKWYESVLEVNGLPYLPFVPQAVSNAFLKEQPGGGHEGFKWVFAGRLSPEKGIKELAELFKKNALPGDLLILFLFLSDKQGEFEQELLETLQQQENVIIHTNQQADKVAVRMKECDCLVLPTKICEMAPLVIGEAFSLHIPVLVSKFIREEILPEQGVKFSYDVQDDFADKFNFMRKHSREMKKRGFKAHRPNSFLQVAEKHLQIYSEALES